jgi:hypothetical protein
MQVTSDATLAQLRDEVNRLVTRAIAESRNAEIEAREETIRDHILKVLKAARELRKEITIVGISDALGGQFTISDVIDELFKLAKEGIVTWDRWKKEQAATGPDVVRLL